MVRVEVLRVGEVLAGVVRADLPDGRDPLPAERGEEAERDDDPGPCRRPPLRELAQAHRAIIVPGPASHALTA